MGGALALRDGADAAPGHLAAEDRRIFRQRASDRPEDGQAVPSRASGTRPERHDLGRDSRPGPASVRRARPRGGNDPILAALERLRRVVAGGQGR
jgi:hypothetical protein